MVVPKGFAIDGWNMIEGHIYANIRLTKWTIFKLKIKAYFNLLRRNHAR